MSPAEKKQRIKQILGVGDFYDGSINPEITWPPAKPPDPEQADSGQSK
jgi:hypothetical protein